VAGYFYKKVDVGLSTGPVSGTAAGTYDYNAFFARLLP
jgi:hypothetical protein